MKRLKLFRQQEQFLLLEITPQEMNGTVLSIDSDKKIFIKNKYENTTWGDLSKATHPARYIKNVIVSVDSALAYTATIPVRVLREQKDSQLFATELENVLAQEIGKAFSRCRESAAESLAIDDLDIMLAGSRIGQFKIDGHRVLSPTGLKAKKIEAVLELVFTTRLLFEEVKKFLGSKRNLYFAEAAAAELNVIEKTEKLPIRLLRLRSPFSSKFVLQDALIGHEVIRNRISWSSSYLFEVIEKEWGVSRRAAKELYHSYLDQNMSESGTRVIAKLLDETLKELFSEIQKSKLRGKTFVDTDVSLPFDLPLKKGAIELNIPPVLEILSRLGFELSENWPLRSEVTFALLAPFIAFYSDRSDSTVNRWLRRHLTWLGAYPGGG